MFLSSDFYLCETLCLLDSYLYFPGTRVVKTLVPCFQLGRSHSYTFTGNEKDKYSFTDARKTPFFRVYKFPSFLIINTHKVTLTREQKRVGTVACINTNGAVSI